METQNQKPYLYRDFLEECRSYEHSKEHYEIMKESAELFLMEQYRNDQQYVAENAESMKEVNFTEGYFQESVNEEYIKEMSEKIDVKAKKLIERIGKGIKGILEKFFRFLKSIKDKLTKKKGEDFIDPKSVTEDQRKQYSDTVCKELEKLCSSNGINIEGNGISGFVNGFKFASGKAVTMKLSKENAVSAEILVECATRLKDAKVAHDVKSIHSRIKNAMGKPIKVSLAKDTKELQLPDFEGLLNDAITFDTEGETNFVNEINLLRDTLNKVIPATSALYSAVFSMIVEVKKPLKTVVEKIDPKDVEVIPPEKK